MNGHNALFQNNVTTYMNDVIIDNVAYFRNMANNGFVTALTVPKTGQFDLMPSGINPRRVQFRIAPVAGIIGDAPINAYWCPFDNGGGIPGWVDLPLHNPAHRLMFTAAMQGCALVITNSPVANHIRVYHHQHPDMNNAAAPAVWNALHAVGQPVISILQYDDYGLAGLNGNAPNAFNFLLYRNATWNYVTQAHTLTNVIGPNGGPTIQVNRRLPHGNNGVSIAAI
jgi:hypothetical protein